MPAGGYTNACREREQPARAGDEHAVQFHLHSLDRLSFTETQEGELARHVITLKA
jgi:hypothetical protein